MITSELAVYPDIEQGSEAWHTQRRGMITASVVGQLLTARSMSAIEYPCPACNAEPLSPCLSKVKRDGVSGAPIKQAHPERAAVAHELRDTSPTVVEPASGDAANGLVALLAAERITGRTEPTYMSDDMWRGIEDEPLAADVYSKHYAPVTTTGFMVRSWDGGRLGYSPDGLVGDDGLIEVKSRRAKKQVQTVVSGEVPAENMAHAQAGLFVSARSSAATTCPTPAACHLWTRPSHPRPAMVRSDRRSRRSFRGVGHCDGHQIPRGNGRATDDRTTRTGDATMTERPRQSTAGQRYPSNGRATMDLNSDDLMSGPRRSPSPTYGKVPQSSPSPCASPIPTPPPLLPLQCATGHGCGPGRGGNTYVGHRLTLSAIPP